MDYSKCKAKYVDIVVNQKENMPKWKLFEYLVALKLGMVMWEDIDPKFIVKHKLPHNADYGIDLISPDFTKTAQVKYYGSDTNITWRSVSTYIAYSSHVLKIENMTLVTTSDTKISKMVLRSIPNIITYDIDTLYAEVTKPQPSSKWSILNLFNWWSRNRTTHG
jgi:hypothetical protein